jgi:hypothetical protein
VERPQRASARTNDVDARKVRRILGWPGSKAASWRREPQQGLTVAAAEQEDKTVQVLAELLSVVGGVADEIPQGGAEAGRVAGQPAAEVG